MVSQLLVQGLSANFLLCIHLWSLIHGLALFHHWLFRVSNREFLCWVPPACALSWRTDPVLCQMFRGIPSLISVASWDVTIIKASKYPLPPFRAVAPSHQASLRSGPVMLLVFLLIPPFSHTDSTRLAPLSPWTKKGLIPHSLPMTLHTLSLFHFLLTVTLTDCNRCFLPWEGNKPLLPSPRGS